jgi:AbiV family abortive infection protein
VATSPNLFTAIEASILNGKRLLEDARLLLEYERFPTAFSVACLSEEEFSKAFMLGLVQEGAIPWSPEVHKSLKRHECKHLVAVMMDWLAVPIDELLERGQAWFKMSPEEQHQSSEAVPESPDDVNIAMNIYRHEKIERIGGRWPERESGWDGLSRRIADGFRDRQKQTGLYVGISKTGWPDSLPVRISAEQATTEIKQASRIGEFAERIHAGVHHLDKQYSSLKRALKSIFADLFEDPDLALIEAFWDSEAALHEHLRHEAEFLTKIVFAKRAIIAPTVELRPGYGKPRFLADLSADRSCTPSVKNFLAPLLLDSIACTDGNLIRLTLVHELIHRWENSVEPTGPAATCPGWIAESVQRLFGETPGENSWRREHSDRFLLKAALIAKILQLPYDRLLTKN